MIAGPVREPADLPGHHHLARRARRRPGPAARHHRPRGDLCRPRRQGRAARSTGWAKARPRRRRPRPSEGDDPARGRPRRRRHGEQRLALGHGGRAEAARARDLRLASPTTTRSCAACRTSMSSSACRTSSSRRPRSASTRSSRTRSSRDVKSLSLNNNRIEALVEQLYDINKRLISHRGPPDAPGREPRRRPRASSSSTTRAGSSTRNGCCASPSSAARGWKDFVANGEGPDPRPARADPQPGVRDRPGDPGVPPHRP